MAKLTLSFKDRKLKIFALGERAMFIGRDPACDIHIDSLAVEPRHAVIDFIDGRYHIKPVEPVDSLRINQQTFEDHPLEDGDHIQVGKHQLTFDAESNVRKSVHDSNTSRQLPTGWLQIMSGSHLGRTIRLDRAMTRLGKSGHATAVIARRNNGYFISHLEGEHPPTINDVTIGEGNPLLRDGDKLDIGGLILHFFVDSPASDGAPKPVPQEEKEQRRFTRIPFDADVTLSRGDDQWHSTLIDLSLKGALISRPSDWDDAASGEFLLTLSLDEDVVIRMDTDIAHVEAKQIGLHCKDIDLDSITHLRRLVELNLGDASLLERELANLG